MLESPSRAWRVLQGVLRYANELALYYAACVFGHMLNDRDRLKCEHAISMQYIGLYIYFI